MYIASSQQLKPSFRALFNQAEIMLENGKTLDVVVQEHKHRRSSEQNNYYWLFNGQLSDFLNDSGLSYGEFNLPTLPTSSTKSIKSCSVLRPRQSSLYRSSVNT